MVSESGSKNVVFAEDAIITVAGKTLTSIKITSI